MISVPAEQVESIEIMKGAASTLYGSCCSWSYQYHLKKAGKKAIAERPMMNIGTQTTADRTTSPEDYNQGLLLMEI
jgi:vitamin B12 transporter